MKLRNNFYILITLLFSLLIFISCSDDDDPTAVVGMDEQLVGEWTLTKITIPLYSMELTPEEAGFMVTGNVKSDGTYQMNTTDSTGTIIENGKWSTTGSNLTLASDDGTAITMGYAVSGSIIAVTTPIEMEEGVEVPAILEFNKQ